MGAPIMTKEALIERLRYMLVDAGVNGMTQKQITANFANMMKANEIKEILERWRLVGAVQKFRVEESTKPITIWRATTKLIEEEGDEYKF